VLAKPEQGLADVQREMSELRLQQELQRLEQEWFRDQPRDREGQVVVPSRRTALVHFAAGAGVGLAILLLIMPLAAVGVAGSKVGVLAAILASAAFAVGAISGATGWIAALRYERALEEYYSCRAKVMAEHADVFGDVPLRDLPSTVPQAPPASPSSEEFLRRA
jgi:hypothetical protein